MTTSLASPLSHRPPPHPFRRSSVTGADPPPGGPLPSGAGIPAKDAGGTSPSEPSWIRIGELQISTENCRAGGSPSSSDISCASTTSSIGDSPVRYVRRLEFSPSHPGSGWIEPGERTSANRVDVSVVRRSHILILPWPGDPGAFPPLIHGGRSRVKIQICPRVPWSQLVRGLRSKSMRWRIFSVSSGQQGFPHFGNL